MTLYQIVVALFALSWTGTAVLNFLLFHKPRALLPAR